MNPLLFILHLVGNNPQARQALQSILQGSRGTRQAVGPGQVAGQAQALQTGRPGPGPATQGTFNPFTTNTLQTSVAPASRASLPRPIVGTGTPMQNVVPPAGTWDGTSYNNTPTPAFVSNGIGYNAGGQDVNGNTIAYNAPSQVTSVQSMGSGFLGDPAGRLGPASPSPVAAPRLSAPASVTPATRNIISRGKI